MSPRAKKAQRVEAETTVTESSAPVEEATPVATETAAAEPVAVVPEAPKATVEVWWSMRARRHCVEIVSAEGVHEMVVFENNTKRLDLDKPEEKAVSEALKRSRAFNKDIFIVGQAAPGHMAASASQQEWLRTMQKKVFTETGDVDPDGFASLRALFTNKELVDEGINPNAKDPYALIILALKTKVIGGE